MFGTIQIVINRTKEGYATWEFDNILGYVDYDNEIMNSWPHSHWPNI
jgi:hypothetical protein